MKLAQYLALLPLCLASSGYYFDGSATSNGDGTQSSPYNTLTSIPNLSLSPGGLAAPGLRDRKAYQLLTGYATLDSATAVPGDAAVDFFNYPTSAHLNRGFYSGTGTKTPTGISRFDDSSISGWIVTGTASIVADPSGGLGKSLSLASGVSITKLFLSLFRFALIQREWQILEIAFSDSASSATVDGESVGLVSVTQIATVNTAFVKINGGAAGLIVDDIFVTAV
ncbi:Pectin lyase fold/virulence factor [Penicillium samsonianum]|uniref:Pectin lyase fold/virulence factor n=1 Tax=Penicillium samsonianum TaxID=1882272 RepID=UPI002547EAEE|nr:Pectin lyase fold/virulence factor [Penicillium samsonianum]KAJ6118555.1 Pectin lyase fold/virulence factor [Penicillium samsonianum]